tara:strand:+ start:40 stop:429 length:390 start_codon:yes stop_codon:yes gene_type:complete
MESALLSNERNRLMIKVEPAQNIEDGIQNLINASNEDYAKDMDNKNMIEEFKNSWVVKSGQKFIKIVAKKSVHSFIVKEDMFTPGGQPKFKKGDVLKAASWSKPALNQPRGNVLEGNYPIQWTGPLYLR